MTRTLVVYYSRTGTTRRAAKEIASVLGADLEEVLDHTQRSGWIGYLRSFFEGTFQGVVEVDPPKRDLESYDLVVLGTPTWNASLSSPVRAFIRQYRGRLKAVAFFCTCGGRGGDHVLRQMTWECGKHPAAVLTLREADVSGGGATTAIREFVDRTLLNWHTRTSRPSAARAQDSLRCPA